VGDSNNVILRLCDPVDQPSANLCANLCPAHLKSRRTFSIFCWLQPKMDIGIISWCWGTWNRPTRRCDDTVDKKRVNSCVLKQLFLERVEQPKISPKEPGNALSDALLMSCFQKFAALAAKKNRFFETALRAVLNNELIRGQRFWEVVFFTGVREMFMSLQQTATRNIWYQYKNVHVWLLQFFCKASLDLLEAQDTLQHALYASRLSFEGKVSTVEAPFLLLGKGGGEDERGSTQKDATLRD